jgi:hypothetical protein
MMVPRVRHDASGSRPHTTARRRQQDPHRAASCAPTGLRRSSDGHAITCTGPKLSPTAMLACTQGLGTPLLDTLVHSYAPRCTSRSSPCLYKREVQGHPEGGSHEGSGGRTLRLSLSRYALVTPTTSGTLVQDNTRLVPPLVFHPAPTHLGRGTQRFHWSAQGTPSGPRRRQLARQVGACCVLMNTFPLSSRWGVFSNLSGPGRCSASGVSSSCPSTAAMTWYSSPRGVTTTMVSDSPGGGELYDSISPRQKRSTSVVPATLLVAGGGGEATMATQEAAPCRLSHQSESTTPALPQGTCRALSSHLRRRRVSLPRDVLAPSGLMTPAPSRRTCWALPSYLR